VVIRAFAQNGAGSGVAQSDARGRYEISQLPAGRYIVSASRSGFVTTSFGQRAPDRPGTPIEVADGQTADRVNFALPRGGSISGRIVDDDGEPVASAQVVAQRYWYVGGSRRLVGAASEGGSDRSDGLGQFRLYALPPGEYYVSAVLVFGDNREHWRFGSGALEHATPFQIREGERKALNLRLVEIR
jgi:hypothetical protein